MKWALTSFRFIVIAVEFIVISGFMLRFWLDVQINDLDDEINQKAALVSSRSSFEKEFRSIQNKLVIYQGLTDPNARPSIYFENVAKNVPVDTQLVSFSKTADIIEVTGATLNEGSISTFIGNLESQPEFASVDLLSVSTQEDSPLVEFSLTILAANNTVQP